MNANRQPSLLISLLFIIGLVPLNLPASCQTFRLGFARTIRMLAYL